MTREESIEIYKRYSRKLFNVSLRIVGDAGEAEEIMQDTVLKFIRQGMGDQVGNERAVSAWMVRTCVRASIDAVRKRKRERLFLEEYAEVNAGMDVAAEGTEDIGRIDIPKIKRAIAQLPDSFRIMLTLVLIEGLDYEEISGITGESEGTLRTRYSRARKILAEKLKK